MIDIWKSNVTQVVDRLEAQGLVVGVPAPSDRRGVLAAIVPEVRRRLEAAALDYVERQLTSCLAPDEQRLLAVLLGRFPVILRQLPRL